MNKRGKTYEGPDMVAFLRRVARAMVRRAGEGDREMLACMAEMYEYLGISLGDAARAAHAHGYSWTEIAAELGITRQAARQRFSRHDVSDEGGSSSSMA